MEYKEKSKLIPKWYIIHTYTGYENKVKNEIDSIVENRSAEPKRYNDEVDFAVRSNAPGASELRKRPVLSDYICEVRVPTETIRDKRGSVVKDVESKRYPGYVLIKMVIDDITWPLVRGIRGVTGFVSMDNTPVALSDEEVMEMGDVRKDIDVDFKVGDRLKVLADPFAGFFGTVVSINKDTHTVILDIDLLLGKGTKCELPFEAVAHDSPDADSNN